MRDLLTAIGLTASFTAELNLRVRVGLPIVERDFFLRSAWPAFLSPEQFMRALQAGIQFSQPPPNVRLGTIDGDGRESSGGFGRDHRVGGGAQRIYPLRRNPQ
jgi:hypothetical protein